MALIKDFLDRNGAELAAVLVARSGFTTDQARLFLPEAIQSTFVSLAGQEHLDLSSSADLTGPVIDRIDVERLAGVIGVSHNEAAVGLARIIFMVIEALDTQYARQDGRLPVLDELVHPDQGNRDRPGHHHKRTR